MLLRGPLSRHGTPAPTPADKQRFTSDARARYPQSPLNRRHAAALGFGLTFGCALVVAVLQSPEPFYYDSGSYWALGQSFTAHGHFSLLNFESPVRGYLLPLIYHVLRVVADAFNWSYSSTAKLANALVFALIAGVLAPRFAEVAWPRWRWGVWRRLALVSLLLVFWAGFLNFPLSDFPALAFTMLALVCVARPEAPGWMLVAGLSCGAAIDIRPSYVPLAPILVVLVAWAWFEQRGKPHTSARRRSACAALFVVGLIVVSIPQSLATHRHFHSWSFVPGGPEHLTGQQLTRGMFLQRYDTYVGTGHEPEMLYRDNAGLALLQKQTRQEVSGGGQYLELLFTHPIVIGGLALSHLVNGLDQRYNTPYIAHLDTGSHRWLRGAGFLITFLALLRLLWPSARRRLATARWRYPAALALCCLTSVPSAIETRYLLPLYLLGYILLLLPAWPNPIREDASGVARYRTVAIVGVSAIAYAAVVLAVTSDASSHLRFGI